MTYLHKLDIIIRIDISFLHHLPFSFVKGNRMVCQINCREIWTLKGQWRKKLVAISWSSWNMLNQKYVQKCYARNFWRSNIITLSMSSTFEHSLTFGMFRLVLINFVKYFISSKTLSCIDFYLLTQQNCWQVITKKHTQKCLNLVDHNLYSNLEAESSNNVEHIVSLLADKEREISVFIL